MTGRLTFEAVSGPDVVGADETGPPYNGTAFYRVRGTVSPGHHGEAPRGQGATTENTGSI
jgi:hypothetical protein